MLALLELRTGIASTEGMHSTVADGRLQQTLVPTVAGGRLQQTLVPAFQHDSAKG